MSVCVCVGGGGGCAWERERGREREKVCAIRISVVLLISTVFTCPEEEKIWPDAVQLILCPWSIKHCCNDTVNRSCDDHVTGMYEKCMYLYLSLVLRYMRPRAMIAPGAVT